MKTPNRAGTEARRIVTVAPRTAQDTRRGAGEGESRRNMQRRVTEACGGLLRFRISNLDSRKNLGYDCSWGECTGIHEPVRWAR